MKRNIDLTANRDFKDNEEPMEIMFRHVSSLPHESNTDELIFTGNKRDIQEKKNLYNIKKMEKENCHKCGAYTGNIAWLSDDGLCIDCGQELSKEFQKEDIFLREVYGR